MSAGDARAVADTRPERAGGWGRKGLIPAMLLVVLAAVVTWLNVVKTMRDPDPLAIPERPPIAGIVWSNRVFIHERSLERWLEARGQSYAAWARKHPRAVAVLRDRALPPPTNAASRKPQQAAAAAAVESSEELRVTVFALIVAGMLGALALLLVAARWAVVVLGDRSSPPGAGRGERLREASPRGALPRLREAFLDTLEVLRAYPLRVALWLLTAVIAAAGFTLMLGQLTQP